MGDDGGRRLPPGFRFRPTDEELLTHYLAPKAADAGFATAAVREADLYGAEPWDLLPAGGVGGGGGGYFFCRRSVKFPSGLRSNRATRAGYWKSTGKDRVVLRRQQHGGGDPLPLGLKKTLVFYRGRAPNGSKTNWAMHEYRLVQGHGGYTPSPVLATGAQSGEWVICRVFMRKPPGETGLLEEETVVILNPPHLNDHLMTNPSFDIDGCKAAVAAAADHAANCFSGALAIAPADGPLEMTGQGALLQLNHDEEELAINNDRSVSDYASLLLDDELSSDTFDLLPQLLDYEGFPFLQDF